MKIYLIRYKTYRLVFDQRTHGELMSRFTSDIDTILEALNNSFAMLIQSFIMIVGTITMIIILNPYLSIIVIASMVMMFIFIRYSSKRVSSILINNKNIWEV